MCVLRKCLLTLTVLLFIRKNEAERCRTNSFYNVQLVIYNTDYYSAIISVSGCISPVTLKGIGGSVRRVLCNNQHIPSLREQAVSSLSHLETIRFEKSAITTIMTGAFTNLSSLRNVYLTENQIESLNVNSFVDVPKLKVLSLYKNNLEHFDKSWLGNVSDLEILDLSYNVIEFIARDTFLNLKTLRVLHMEHNNIRHITEKAFDELEELETLDLSYNKIGRLYDNLFASTKQLSRLNLYGNSLTYISEQVLRNLRTVNELILLYNPWQCECFDKIIEWNEKFKTVKLNSDDLICEKTTDISSIAVCVTSNETRCVQNPKEDLVSVYLSEQPDYRCSLIKPYSVSKERDDPCTTPNRKVGRCVPLDDCQVVFDATITRKKENTEFAKKSFCSFDTEALVCCESPGPVVAADFFESTVLPDRATCGLVTEASRIIKGKVANLGEFPWMAALEYKSKRSGENGGIRCGGSLITSQYVLTAAHCILDREFELTSVRLGEWRISTDPDCVEYVANTECADLFQNVKIKELIPHFFYSKKNGYNDIGLVLLEHEVKFTDYIKPICLPSPNVPSPEVGTLMSVAGWGATENGTFSDVLQKVDIPLISNDHCSSKLSLLSPQQLCAGGTGKDSCQGDSGGPIMIIVEDNLKEQTYWYQEGVSSYGLGCGRAGYPAIYTQIFGYMNWIINVLSNK